MLCCLIDDSGGGRPTPCLFVFPSFHHVQIHQSCTYIKGSDGVQDGGRKGNREARRGPLRSIVACVFECHDSKPAELASHSTDIHLASCELEKRGRRGGRCSRFRDSIAWLVPLEGRGLLSSASGRVRGMHGSALLRIVGSWLEGEAVTGVVCI